MSWRQFKKKQACAHNLSSNSWPFFWHRASVGRKLQYSCNLFDLCDLSWSSLSLAVTCHVNNSCAYFHKIKKSSLKLLTFQTVCIYTPILAHCQRSTRFVGKLTRRKFREFRESPQRFKIAVCSALFRFWKVVSFLHPSYRFSLLGYSKKSREKLVIRRLKKMEPIEQLLALVWQSSRIFLRKIRRAHGVHKPRPFCHPDPTKCKMSKTEPWLFFYNRALLFFCGKKSLTRDRCFFVYSIVRIMYSTFV